jgi:uncharacterized lipoprotein YajG
LLNKFLFVTLATVTNKKEYNNMNKIILSLAAILMLSACGITIEAGLTTQKGISTTGDGITSATQNATKASKSSSDDKDGNWEYDEGKAL